MICRYCGTQNDENAVFCIGCGNKLDEGVQTTTNTEEAQQPYQNTYNEGTGFSQEESVNNTYNPYSQQGPVFNNDQQEPKKKFLLAMVIVGVVAAILIIIGIVLICNGISSDDKEDDNTSATVSDNNDNRDDADYAKTGEAYYVVSYWSEDSSSLDLAFADGSVTNLPFSKDSYKNYMLDQNGEKGLFLGKYADDAGTLYYVNKDGSEIVAEDAYEYFSISADGSTVLYFNNVDNMTATLNKYDTESGDSEVVDKDVYYYGNIAISPDGKSIAYSKDYDVSSEDFTSYVKTGSSDPVKIGTKLSFLALANDAKNIVYSAEGVVTAQPGVDGAAVALGKTESGTLIFNNDISEVMFANEASIFYWDTKASSPLEIGKVAGDVYMLTNSDCAYSYYEKYDDDFNEFKIYNEGISSLKDHFFMNDYSINYLRDGGCDLITKTAYYYSVGRNGNGFFYADDTDNCYVIADPAKSLEPKTVAEKLEWSSMAVTESDFTTIYYIDTHNDLYIMKDGAEKRVDMGAKEIYMDLIDGDVVYYTSSDDLKIYRPEDKTTQMVFNKESITDVFTDANGGVYFETDAGNGSVYIYKVTDEDQYKFLFK